MLSRNAIGRVVLFLSLATTFAEVAAESVAGLYGSSVNLGNIHVIDPSDGTQVDLLQTLGFSALTIIVPLPPSAWMGLALLGGLGVVGVVRKRLRTARAEPAS